MTGSGVNIDCNYMKYVKHYMPVRLPRPRKKPSLTDIDGEEIPVISVTIGALE
jgi:hypothetical protein